MKPRIDAVVFDCYGTLIDFDDSSFERAYGQICAEQGLPIDGKTIYDKWMEIWRRGEPSAEVAAALRNQPGPLSEPEPSTLNERIRRMSGGQNRSLEGPPPPFRPYRDEWPEHFQTCFDELGVPGDAAAASDRLREILASAAAYPDARRTVEALSRRMTVAVLSNADNDFLLPVLQRNGLIFPLIVSSEDVAVYKPHFSIFSSTADALGVPLTNILYVGDSRTADVIGSKHAGMVSAWLNRRGEPYHPRNGEPRPFEPDFEVRGLDDLLKVFDGSA